ncbi:hypothetical protein UUU_04640 [Klebsiella pneumoniae subsp. pneumoniae DSM 30104 = JCM 1662 = NBRC 14940]|nr:hypothetical protein UUU_04640 [Klebsiella pneumoniae subsp. pneumoniae DSM 30104 = JCM 1662 = NBRC 14940]
MRKNIQIGGKPAHRTAYTSINKKYDRVLFWQVFFNIMQQTMQHCRVALLQQAQPLRQPVGQFGIILHAQTRK